MIIHESILSMEGELHLKFLCLFNPSFVTSWVSPKKQNDGYMKTEILGIERTQQTNKQKLCNSSVSKEVTWRKIKQYPGIKMGVALQSLQAQKQKDHN